MDIPSNADILALLEAHDPKKADELEFEVLDLVIPGWGEVGTGGACLLGGIAGGFGLGLAGDKLDRAAGEAIYDFVTSFRY